MDISAAFVNGYNMGKDIGYNISGRAAEDIRLNREAQRAKIDTLQAQADLAQQQAQYVREDREEQRKMQGYQGLMTIATQAASNPMFMSQFYKAANDFNDEFGYMPDWLVTSALDDEMRDDNKLNAAVQLAVTVHSKFSNPNDADDATIDRITQGMVKMTNKSTGETQYGYVGDLLYAFGGDYGLAYMHSIIQQKQLEQKRADEKARLEAADKLSQMNKREIDAQVAVAKENREQNEFQTKQNQLNQAQQFWDNGNQHRSFNPTTGAIGAEPTDKGAQQVSPEVQAANMNNATNRLATIAQTDGKNFLYNIPANELRNIVNEYITAVPKGKNATEQKMNEATHFEPLIQLTEKLYEAKANNIPGADERINQIESALSYYDEQFGSGKNTDSKLSQRLAVFNSAIRTGNILSETGDGITGILNTAILNAEDFLNTPRDSEKFRKAQEAIRELTASQMVNLGELYNGRLTNKVLAELRQASKWRSFISNAADVTWALQRLADRADQDAKIASPSQAGQARFVAKQLRNAANNLAATVRLETKIMEGKVNDMNVLDAKTGSLEKAAQASQSNDTVYFDGKGSVYIIPQNPDKTLDNYKYSMKDFKAAVDKNGKSQNWMTSWLPGVENKTAWSQFTN